MPPRRRADQSASKRTSSTGETERTLSVGDTRAQAGNYLTTAQGLRLPDTDHSLKAGDRGPTLLEDFHLREKITHFDHERIPERVVHARGAAAHGVFESYGTAASVTKAGFLAKGAKTDVFMRFSTVAGFAGVGRHGARRPRVRGEVLHRRGQLRPGRQQHAGVLHPGRHQVPRHHPRRQAAARPGDPAGPVRARHVLGLRVAAHRGDPPRAVGDERPGHPAVVPDDGGLRRPHLPPGQRRRRDQPGEVPLEAGRRRALAGLGGSPDRRRVSTRTSTAATWPTASRPAPSWSGSSASR